MFATNRRGQFPISRVTPPSTLIVDDSMLIIMMVKIVTTGRGKTVIDDDLLDRLKTNQEKLQKRALEQAHPGKDPDLSLLMTAQALQIEALKALIEKVRFD